MSISLYLSESDSPYEIVRHTIESWADKNGYDDFVVTLRLNDRETSELLCCDGGMLVWLNDWWEGEKTELVGFVPLRKIRVRGGYHGAAQLETV